MSRYLKYYPQESLPFSPTNFRMTVAVPPEQDAFVDMKSSHMLLDLELTNSAGSTYEGTINLGKKSDRSRYDASMLVKHARLEAERMGIIEENRFNNVYQQSMRHLLKTRQDEQAGSYYGEGECNVKANKTQLKVPLSKLYGLGEEIVPMRATGRLDMRLELENVIEAKDLFYQNNTSLGRDYLKINIDDLALAGGPTADIVSTTTFLAEGNFNELLKDNDEVKITYTPHGGSPTELVTTIVSHTYNVDDTVAFTLADTVDVSGGNTTAITLEYQAPEAYRDIEDYTNATAGVVTLKEFTVTKANYEANNYGDLIRIGDHYRLAGLNNTVQLVASITIESIKQTGDDVVFTFAYRHGSGVFSVGISHTVSHLSLSQTSIGDITAWSVTGAAVVIRQLMAVPENVLPKTYSTYMVENVNIPTGLTDIREQFMVESGTEQSLLLALTAGDLIGKRHGMVKYRTAVDGRDTTDTDIEVHESLYNDRILTQVPDAKNLDKFNGTAETLNIVQNYYEIEGNKTLDVHIQGSASPAGMILAHYKQVMREL